MSAQQELYQHKKTGQIVELLAYHDRDYGMIRNQEGKVSYCPLGELDGYVPGKGRTGEQPKPLTPEGQVDPDAIPTPAIPLDTRLNINMATAEMISTRIKGIGFSTAKRIVELRQSLPGERFATLKQLESVGRVNWEEVFKQDIFYVA